MRHVWAALTVLILCAAPAAAQTEQNQPTPEALSGVYACAGIQTDAERLACYDAAVGRMRQAETEGQFVAVERAQVETMRRESFGFSLPSVGNLFGGRGEDELSRVELEIARVIGLADGRHVFVMSDGQRWVQIEPRRTSNVRPGDTVTVRRAALGSFMLVSERGGAAHRVRREG